MFCIASHRSVVTWDNAGHSRYSSAAQGRLWMRGAFTQMNLEGVATTSSLQTLAFGYKFNQNVHGVTMCRC